MGVKQLSILGSTGSVGLSAVKAAKQLGIRVLALAAHSDVDGIERQARELKPDLAVLYDKPAAAELHERLTGTGIAVDGGPDGLLRAAAQPGCNAVLTAIVGIVGLLPTLEAIKAGKTVALANKETLVAGGDIVMPLARERGVDIIPVDSEHSAIFQCMQGASNSRAHLRRVILTASGGPFLGFDRERLRTVTARQALGHPVWSMGKKITIDSATMMNKGLEVIEAMHLFGLPLDSVDAVVHPEGIVHSLVEFNDHSLLAQLSYPNMELPIRYALSWPERADGGDMRPLELSAIGALTFRGMDGETFGCYALCRRAAAIGGSAPAVISGANEAAVAAFLGGGIGFLDIERLCAGALDSARIVHEGLTLKHIMEADAFGREYVRESLSLGR